MVHLSTRLFLLGCAAFGVLSRTTIQSQSCTKEACFFSWINLGPYPSSGALRGRCGEVDAAPRMPAGIFNNPFALAEYIDFTIKYYSIDNAELEQKPCDRKGRLQHSNQSVSWTDPTLMKEICGPFCKCTYPNCPDVPDRPQMERFCSLCGPKFNAPIQVQFWVPKNSFVSAAQLLQARTYHAASPLGFGRVLIAGGEDYDYQTLATTEIYSPLSDSFTPGPPLASKRLYHSASPLPDGQVLIAGGQDANGVTLNTTEIYKPETNSFAPGPPLASTRYRHAASPLPDGRVLIVGGNGTSDDILLDSSEIYNPKTNSFAPGPRLAAARSNPAASPLPDGRVLVAGGDVGGLDQDLLYPILSTTEIYNPKTNSFASGPPLATARTHSTASPLPDGRVLIAGGYTLFDGQGYGGLATSEIYNPQTNSFAPGPELARKRFNFAASPLKEGVLITGGLSPGVPPRRSAGALYILNTTEIYLFNNN